MALLAGHDIGQGSAVGGGLGRQMGHLRYLWVCYLCGQFWGGVETFEFTIIYGGIEGVCENCEAELREDLDDYQEDEDDYFTDYL